MDCHRCRNMMFPVDLIDVEGGLLHKPTQAWRCFACGEIVDNLIAMNRTKVQESRPEDWHRRGARLRSAAIGSLR